MDEFRNLRPASPVGDEVTAGPSDVSLPGATGGKSGVAGSAEKKFGGLKGLTKEVKPSTVLGGRGPVTNSSRLFKYDVLAGSKHRMNVVVTRDSVMSPTAAADMLDRIHKVCGVSSESEAVIYNFDRALFRCYTFNSGSVLNPGRSEFMIPGFHPFQYSIIRDLLGADLRRFGRAFADPIRDENLVIMSEFDPYDADKAEAYYALQQIAHSRGTQRMMHLSHDSALFCTGLSAHERSVLTAAANSVISANTNSADRMRNNDRVQSAEAFDSTTGETLGATVAGLAGAAARGFAGA